MEGGGVENGEIPSESFYMVVKVGWGQGRKTFSQVKIRKFFRKILKRTCVVVEGWGLRWRG